MKKAVVRVVCAIGQAGQLGLKGGLPWEGDRSPEFVADVARFFDLTRGHVLLASPKTIASVPDFARADRELVVVRSSMDPEDTLRRFAGRVVFIGGGPPVWDASHASSATGMSRGCPMTVRRTAGSMQDGLQGVAELPEITATNEGRARIDLGLFPISL